MLLAVLAVIALGSVAYVALRNRIMFMMGLRNIPRRRAQTMLIVIGLMLSTLIISAAFTTGDTRRPQHQQAGLHAPRHVDEIIQVTVGNDLDDPHSRRGGADISRRSVRRRFRRPLRRAEQRGHRWLHRRPLRTCRCSTRRAARASPLVNFVGLDADRPRRLSRHSFRRRAATTLDVAALAPDEVFINESAADELDVRPGDSSPGLRPGQRPHDFTIVDVVEDRVPHGRSR